MARQPSLELNQAAWRSISRRSRAGLLGYPLIFALLSPAMSLGARGARVYLAGAALILGLTALRAYLILRFDPLYETNPGRWRLLYTSSLVLLLFLLAGQVCWILMTHGPGPWSYFAVTVAAATMSLSVIVYAHDLSLAVWYVVLLVVPMLGALFAISSPEVSLHLTALGLVLYAIYLIAMAQQLHRERWKGLETNRLLALRAAEVEGAQQELQRVHDQLERQFEELRLAKEAAERADLAKTEFLANMSHEIRTPLAGVIGLADLLLKSGLEGRQRDYAALVQSAGESLLRLIDDILDFSKIEAGKLVLEQTPYELRSQMREICDLLRFRAHEKGIPLGLTVADAVPDWVDGDPARLRQVLLNLIGNAIKFTATGRVDLEVIHEDVAGVDLTVFQVRDTGIGISPEERDRIFWPFSQADSSTSRRFGGTGLGLAISRRIVEQMGGEIDFESTPGEGSVFRFRLPLAATVPPADAGTPRAVRPAQHGRPRHILVAEDHPINQLVAVRQLEAFGYEVTAVSNGREALAVLGESSYDLILLDCQMPEMDGYETARRLRARTAGRNPRLPIVALTAHALKEDLDRCLEAGMDDYITKPFHPDTLRRTVERWLSGGGTAAPPPVVPPPAGGDEPHLDVSRLAGLRELGRLGGSDVLRDVIARFREQPLLAALRQALEERDRKELALHAHTLKGTSSVLGAVRLARLCGELERMAPEAGHDACARQLATIAEEYDQVLGELGA
ncbi:MAG TPA: ATP-binding protein [Thermoanaerobaculia bacterium]|nr:ATP-binding protein [Thermoanaerobaculia bacterium]